jgi:cysteine protease ATG4
MDWTRYLPQQREGEGGLERSLSGLQRARLGISQTWYTLVEKFGLQRLKAIISGVNTLPPSNEPLYLLGKEYKSLNPPEKTTEEDGGGGGEKQQEEKQKMEELTEAFAEDMASRVWVTYRSGFCPIGPSGLTTDAGWGCTIRSGQMLMANCLLVHFKGREWRRSQGETEQQHERESERDILSLFFDTEAPEHYLSIHNIIKQGQSFGIVAGHWVGPFVLSQTLEKIINCKESSSSKKKRSSSSPKKKKKRKMPFALYLVSERGGGGGIPTLYRSEAQSRGYPQLILIPLTLGHTPSINPRYIPQILTVLSMGQCVGIIGGKPGSSVYVIGRQGDRLLYLDPHTLKPAGSWRETSTSTSTSGSGSGSNMNGGDTQDEAEDVESFFCDSIHHMPGSRLDPSLCIGFYCREKDDFEDLYKRLEGLCRENPTTCLVSIAERPSPIKPPIYETDETDEGFCEILS